MGGGRRRRKRRGGGGGGCGRGGRLSGRCRGSGWDWDRTLYLPRRGEREGGLEGKWVSGWRGRGWEETGGGGGGRCGTGARLRGKDSRWGWFSFITRKREGGWGGVRGKGWRWRGECKGWRERERQFGVCAGIMGPAGQSSQQAQGGVHSKPGVASSGVGRHISKTECQNTTGTRDKCGRVAVGGGKLRTQTDAYGQHTHTTRRTFEKKTHF
jgi:hypothetical protein